MAGELTLLKSQGVHSPENGRYWLTRRASLTFDIGGPSPSPSRKRQAGGKAGDAETGLRALRVTLISGPRELYPRLPFNVDIIVDDRVVEVVEFGGGSEVKSLELPAPEGVVSFSILSELASIPVEIGLGPDQRELSVMAEFAVVPASVEAAAPPETRHLGPWMQTVAPLVEDLPRPVFVIGMYRSGTSVLTWAIGQHPNIWALEETGWLPLFANGLLAAWQRGSSAARGFNKVYEIQEGQFFAHFGRAIDGMMKSVSKEHAIRVLLGRLSGHEQAFVPEVQVLRALASSKRRWVDGTPENAMAVAQIRMIFPEAKFIHIVRRPADVVASMVHFDRMGSATMAPLQALDAWRERVSYAHTAERAFGSDVVHRLRYSDLIDDPRSAMRRIFNFLGEPYFDTAAETFRVRLNSSRVRGDETSQVETAIAAELQKAMKLYDAASTPLTSPLPPNPAAQKTLDENINDVTTRLLRLFS